MCLPKIILPLLFLSKIFFYLIIFNYLFQEKAGCILWNLPVSFVDNTADAVCPRHIHWRKNCTEAPREDSKRLPIFIGSLLLFQEGYLPRFGRTAADIQGGINRGGLQAEQMQNLVSNESGEVSGAALEGDGAQGQFAAAQLLAHAAHGGMRKELGGAKLTMGAIAFQCGTAYIAALIAYQALHLFGL